MKRLKVLRDESGQAIIFSLLAMAVLCGFVGFAVDVGVLLRAKRSMQTAADSAAIAGAAELNYGGAVAAADAAAAQNGVIIGTNGGAVTVNSPPLYGNYVGKTGYVEAIVSQNQPTGFMGMISHLTSMQVTARAVAYNRATATGCVFVCNPTASGAMALQGSFDVSAPKCGVVVDSNSSTALTFTGGGGTLTAGSVGVVGLASGKTGDSTPAPVTGIAQQSCPLGGITPPVPTGCTTPAGGNLGGGLGTITPGCYSAPAGKNGALGTLNITGVSGTPTFAPGTYVFEGNVNLSGTVTGTGITLEMYNGALTESTNTVLNLVAPVPSDNPTYNGIVILQPYTNTNTLLFDFGSSSGTIDGIIYAPNAELELHDSGGDKNGGLNLITDLIVGTLYDQTATLSITSYSENTPTSPLNRVALVE